ncbi:leucine efflux protein LeuE [Malikia spinosa]|jgi:leucine efflux protein|uniref:Leucine efflux protein LeuE n=1 Tax=Malikia spinosa TaxID=86180 RepID=A0A7C9J8U5_9BURK|nr:leucine efflux protein LeuE [Malikia spinosa]MYZ52670.1 leucine efflux protein LeuE [Malikia spinosa]
MAYGITDLTTFILGTIFIVLLPGPNSLYVMALASRHGVAAGYRGAAGIFAGDTVLMLLSTAGAASLLRSTPLAFMLVKYLGAAYLAWLGIGLVRAAWRQWTARPAQAGTARPTDAKLERNAGRPFRTAFLISLMNPKAILFFVSFFIQFVDPDYAYPALSFLLLGLIVQACSALYLSALIFGGVRLAERFGRHQRLAAGGMGAMGTLFIGFALRLASASLG